jgi:hypothetical protein
MRSLHCSIDLILPAPITVASRSNTSTVFARSNTGIVGSNPTQGIDVCVYSVFVLSCVGIGIAKGWSTVQGVLPTVLELRNWSETKRFTDALCSNWEQQERERERERENPSSRAMALGSTQPLTEMSTRNLPASKGWPARKTDNLTAICETTV